MADVHNLDDSVQEFFEFKVNGYLYRFKHLNSEEVEELQKMDQDLPKIQSFFIKYITKVDEKSPDFSEVMKKMIIPQWRNFRKMISTEFGA